MTKTTIHLAIAFDQNYIMPFNAMLSSLQFNNRDIVCYLHIIATGISWSQKSEIEQRIIKQYWGVKFYEINDERINQFKLGESWSKAAYYRLYFPFLVSETVNRLLYIDTDTIVVGDISKLYNAEIDNYLVAAVYDNYVKRQPLIGLPEEGYYFNSGVLLIDVPKWREQKISEKAIDYLIKYPERILFVDQCALNAVLIGKWKKLDCRFNLLYTYLPHELNSQELPKFLHDKIVVHFTLQRPWNMLCRNRLRSLYFYYLRKSGDPQYIYSDFGFSKIPAWIKIRVLEFYFDSPILQSTWKSFRRIF